jgi:membrane protein
MSPMRFSVIKNLVARVNHDLQCNHTMAMAGALSFYFLLSLFPLLIFLAAMLAYIPIPNLFEEILNLMSRFVPPDAMGMVRRVVQGILWPPRSGLLSFGFLATIWAATGGFAAAIEALNVAYRVDETRPYWRTRLLAVGLTFICGSLVVVALGLSLLGPRFGELLAEHRVVGPIFAAVWPYFRWLILLTAIILAVELLYFWAPNVKQQFRCTLPGAVLGVLGWIGASYALGVYISRFTNYNATYGTLGGVIALMLWLYFSFLAILIGAEVNSELLRTAGKALPMKEPAPELTEGPLRSAA